jgi:hypothetical protein
VERNLLYHFLPELEDYHTSEVERPYVNLLIQHLEEAYKGTARSLAALWQHHEISFNLLPFLFRPDEPIYMACTETNLPRCIKFYSGEVKEIKPGVFIFKIKGNYYDFDGKDFGEAIKIVRIESFSGTKRVQDLAAYPLEYDRDPTMRDQLLQSGQIFVSEIKGLSKMGFNHRQYRGDMFVMEQEQRVPMSADGRIIIDPTTFRNILSSHPRLETSQHMAIHGHLVVIPVPRISSRNLNPKQIEEDGLLFFPPTFLGFSLDKQHWGMSWYVALKHIELTSR